METALVSSYEVSIPGFLLKHVNVDFGFREKIAEGGMSQIHVCEVFDHELRERAEGNEMLVKAMAHSVSQMKDHMRVAFFQELSLMWRFRDHPNFVKLYGYSMEPACLIMKYYQFGDLDDFIKGHGKALDRVSYTKHSAVSLLRQLFSAIETMHAAGFVHCDLKPANILMDFVQSSGQLQAVVSDLGIARIVDDKNLAVSGFEVANLRGLTLAYAAPEVITRFRTRLTEGPAGILKAGDVYALAMIMLEMVQRRSPWK